jgi:hypothetical protein
MKIVIFALVLLCFSQAVWAGGKGQGAPTVLAPMVINAPPLVEEEEGECETVTRPANIMPTTPYAQSMTVGVLSCNGFFVGMTTSSGQTQMTGTSTEIVCKKKKKE